MTAGRWTSPAASRLVSCFGKKAVEWGVIERMPCAIRLLPVSRAEMPFHDANAYESLIEAARREWRAHLIVLLAGDAGLRVGEIVALKWTDVDFAQPTPQLCFVSPIGAGSSRPRRAAVCGMCP